MLHLKNLPLLTFLALGTPAAVSHAADTSSCALKDSEVKSIAARFVLATYPASSSHKWQYEITQHNGTTVTVVASPLPVTPDASVVLHVQCAVQQLFNTVPPPPA